MTRTTFAAVIAGALALTLTGGAGAQPVEVTPLAAPDLFSTAGRATGLPADLWRGASAETARTVLPMLAAKPLSPAAGALARRILATGANGPEGVGQDTALAGARAAALIALGDVQAGSTVLSRMAGLERDPTLSQAAAEAALLSDDDTRACAIGQALTVGRDEAYWLRLRAFCQAKAGAVDVAQLTYDLAQAQARDAVFGRLMAAKLAGGGSPGPASLRNGLDYALSRDLGLAMSGVEASKAVAAARAAHGEPGPATWAVAGGTGEAQAAMAALAAGDLARAQQIRAGLAPAAQGGSGFDLDLLDALIAAAGGRADGPVLDRLAERGVGGEAKAAAKAQAAALILAALGQPLSPHLRGLLAGFTAGDAKAPAPRAFALDLAAEQKLMGEAALIALWIAADAGPGGPAAGDRARIVRALRAVGLEADARAFAVEGLLALR